MSTAKPTPAQRAWLVRIGAGGVRLKTGPSIVNGLRARDATSTYVMTCDLHDAGWISTVERTDARGCVDYPVSLTAAGRQVIA